MRDLDLDLDLQWTSIYQDQFCMITLGINP